MPDPANPYADAVAGAAMPVALPANPYEDAIARVDSANAEAVRAQMVTATAQDPEQHAKALAMADAFQVPVDAVEAARDQLHQAQKLSAVDVQNIVRQHPRLVAWLTDHDNAVIGQDDLHFLARLDTSGRQLAELLSAPEDNRPDLPWWSGVVGRYARRGVIGGLDMLSAPFAVVEMAGREILNAPLTEADYADPGFSPAATIIRDQQVLRDEEPAAQTYRENLGQKAVGGLWETLANPINLLAPIAGGAASAATATAAGLTDAAVAKAALTGASLVMGEQSALQALAASLDEQQRARLAGESGPVLPGIRDLGNAAVQGGIGYLTGYLGGLRGILRGLNPAPIAMRDVLADTAIQATAGGVQGAASAAASQAILPGQQLDGRGILESGLVGTFGGGAMAAGGALVHLRAQEVAARIRDAQAATATAGILARAGVTLSSSKVFARNGERALALLRQSVGDGTGQVYLQAEDLQPLADAAKVPAEVLRERLGITPEELAKAQATKAAIPVDVVRALGEAAKGGEAAVAAAVEKLRGRADGPNLEEARAFAETLPKELEDVQRMADEAASAEPTPRELTPVERVHEDMRAQLLAAGMTQERADTNAALWAARYGARAYWWNRNLPADAPNRMDPHQEYLRDGPSVQRALPEVLTTKTNEFGARLKAEKEQRAATWARQDKAAAQLDRSRHNQADATASDLRTRAAGEDGQALIDKAVEILAAEAKRTGRIPTSGDIMRELGADYGFKPDAGVKLTQEQEAAGKLFLAAMRHRGFDLRLLGEEAALNVAKELGSEWQTLGQRVVDTLRRVVGMEPRQAPALESRQGGQLRGSFEPERFITRLFEAENLSTFAHESGHGFLTMLERDAARGDAPAQIKADWQTVLEFTKAEGGKLGKDQHETFARAWEAYLQEGKAPAAGLMGVFRRFAAWMAIVYKNLAGISRAAGFEVKLSPEVRAVMDRMLASQEEIDAAQAMQHQEGLLAESEIAKAVGMNEVATAEYAARLAAARDAAAQEFMAQELRAEEARKKVLAGEQYRTIADAVRAEVEAQPVYRAIDALRRRETGPGGEAMPGLDRETVAAAYRNTGVEAERKILARLEALGVLADKGTEGISPDLAAPLFGFDSGDALVRAMASARNKEALITAEAKVRLREQHPDLLPTRGEISERAQRAIHGKERAAVLREELVQLGRKVGKETSTRWAEDQQGAMRALAEKEIAGQVVAKLRPDIYRAAERRAAAAALEKARKAAQATAAGRTKEADRLFGEAYIEKQREALNYELHRAATAARDEAQKMGAALKKMTEPAAQERIGKAGGWEWTVAYPDGTAERFTSEEQASAVAAARPGSTWQRSSGYLEQINGILERYDMKPANARQIQRKQTLAQWVSMMEDQGIPVDLPDLPEQNGRQSWTELSVDELRAVHDAVEQIAHLARLKNNFLAAKNKAAFQAVRDELVQSIQANAKGSPRAIKAGESLTKGATLTLDGITGSLERLGDIVQRIDGYQEGGPLWEVLKRPFDEAANRKATLTTAATAKLHDLFATWEKAGNRGRVRDPFSKQHIPAIGQSLTRLERIMVALNMGNEGNRERLQQGFGWNDAQAQAVVDTLDKADAALVRGIAELVNSYWSEIAAKQQRLTGVRPEKVDGAPFTIAGETVEGFYFPVIYDRTQSASAALRDLAQAADMVRRGAFTAATTRRGHTKARTEGSGAPLDLNPNGISRHLEQVIHDLTHHEALIDANRVLRDQEIKTAIEANYGPAVVRTLSDALMRIGGATIRDVDGLERVFKIGTRNVGRMGMAYNVWTALQNTTGVMQSMERVGPLRFIQAMAPLVGSAEGQQSLRAFVFAKSPAMARRFKLSGEHMREETARGIGAIGRDMPDALRPYAMMEAIQQLVDLPTWKAAYDHALELKKDDASAVLIADQAVVDAQSGKDIKDRAGVLEGNEFKKAFTMFYAYFNSTFNLSRRAYLRTNFRDPASVARLAGSFLLLYAIPTAITAAGLALLRPNDKRDGKPLAGRLTAETLAMMAATIPGLRELGAGIKGDTYSGPAGMRGFDTLNRMLVQLRQAEPDKGLGRAAFDAVGLFTGLPTTQIQRTLDGALYDIDHQKADPRPILFGRPR